MRYSQLPHCTHDLVMLRPLVAADLHRWFDYLSRPEVFQRTSWNLRSVDELAPYVADVEPASPSSRLRLAFCSACGERVRHLLEQPDARACLDVLRDFVAGRADRAGYEQARQDIARIANSHKGSPSIDGTDHAAVSATYAVAAALAAKALDAASYSAYAIVYAYGRYAVNDPSAFDGEFAWQIEALRALATAQGIKFADANPA